MGAKLALQKWRAIPMKDRGGGDEREQTKRFTDEFKRKAIRLTMTSGRSIERVAN
jgi:transposase-like protein